MVRMSWEEDQEFERSWWGDCSNTFTEETKQLTYAYKMGLTCYSNNGKWPCYDLNRKSVLDIGGGPVSILLKCENRSRYCMVMDPCEYPGWVEGRYQQSGVDYIRQKGEEEILGFWDEVWIYNVLQHTEDPAQIIKNAKTVAPILRIFEWIDLPAHEGHPQELKEDLLNEWIGGIGTTEHLNENGCYGKAYYGVFNTV